MNTGRRHSQFHAQFWSGFYETTWASYGQAQGSSHVTRDESSHQAFAGCVTLK